jgi:hypothetical protein
VYGCKTWSHDLEEYRLKVFENRVVKRMFGTKEEKITNQKAGKIAQ